jgi:hypothetical protein
MKFITKVYVFMCAFGLVLPLFYLQISFSFIPHCPLDKLIDLNENLSICFFVMLLTCSIISLLITLIAIFCIKYLPKSLLIRLSVPKLGEVMISRGYITHDDLQAALKEQRLKFGEILIGEGIITSDELQYALDIQGKEKIKIGQVLKKLGYLSNWHIKTTLRKMNRRIGEIFIEKGYFTEGEINHILNRIHWKQRW